eukprot:TRINITY_DN964_c0_g1_i1.p1 TRINITY_DN964_c0_g1~~TRINITY_DN964_c0_g1_i1.p1  ORF type:complete len:211 (-),score=62.56 TRINITY_DN964_c0_g1_i1:26-658(-)
MNTKQFENEIPQVMYNEDKAQKLLMRRHGFTKKIVSLLAKVSAIEDKIEHIRRSDVYDDEAKIIMINDLTSRLHAAQHDMMACYKKSLLEFTDSLDLEALGLDGYIDFDDFDVNEAKLIEEAESSEDIVEAPEIQEEGIIHKLFKKIFLGAKEIATEKPPSGNLKEEIASLRGKIYALQQKGNRSASDEVALTKLQQQLREKRDQQKQLR